MLASLEIGLSEPESDLIARAARDADAFGELYERYVDRIYNYIYYRVANVHDAEDLTARVFYRALAHIDEYRDRGAPFTSRCTSRSCTRNRQKTPRRWKKKSARGFSAKSST